MVQFMNIHFCLMPGLLRVLLAQFSQLLLLQTLPLLRVKLGTVDRMFLAVAIVDHDVDLDFASFRSFPSTVSVHG